MTCFTKKIGLLKEDRMGRSPKAAQQKKKDTIFASQSPVGNFVFNQRVADVFDEMLERSVPFYVEMQNMVGELAREFSKDGSMIYDLGCSTGTTMVNIARHTRKKKVRIVGIDNSLPMIDHAKARLKANKCWKRCSLQVADLNQALSLNDAAVVLLILTLQFIRPLHREQLIKHIYERLNKGGCLIVVEKILGSDSLSNRLFIDLYYAFKKRNGYSQLEIAKKREALENVLIPYTLEENRMLLRRNGFQVVDVFFTWYNFAGLIGVKT